MKKIKKILYSFGFALVLITGLCSCENKKEPTKTPETIEEKVEYALTIEYPEGALENIKKPEGTTISLNEFIKDIEGYKFEGFFLTSNYENQVTTHTFNQHAKIYAKYKSIETTPVPPTEEPHTHNFSEKYSYDKNNHFKVCVNEDCSEKTDVAPHTFVKEEKEVYLFSPASTSAPSIYYSHCSVCEAVGELFEANDRIKLEYSLNVRTNINDISFSFKFKDDETVNSATILNVIKNDEKIKNKYLATGLFVFDNYTTLFEDKKLTSNTTVYVYLEDVLKNLTINYVGLSENSSEIIKVTKGETISLSSLDLSAFNDYEVLGWYSDSLLEEELKESFVIENDTTIYINFEIKLMIETSDYAQILPTWYAENKYTANDTFTQKLNIDFSKTVENLTVSIVDDNNNSYNMTLDSVEGTFAQLSKTFSVSDIENGILIKKYVVVADGKTFEIEDNKTVFGLSDKNLVIPSLNQFSVLNDYSNYVVNKEDNPSIWKETIRINYNNSIPFEDNWQGILSYDNIDMDNLDVLDIELEVEEDIFITSREQYLKSIFANENFTGKLNLNGHTITMEFDGFAGDTLFKNNYGEIYNGTIIISGLRNASTNNKEFNTIKNSSAFIENNYGYIHDIKFEIRNFGFDFENNHNIDAVIGVNRAFALVEDCSFELNMKYNGTKENRIKNPIATSSAGIFREVKYGSIYDYSAFIGASQELRNLKIRITSFEASDELKETKGIVNLTCEVQNPLEYVRFNADGEISSVSTTLFHGGNYYYDGTNYIKFNAGMLNSKAVYSTKNGETEYNNQLFSEFDGEYEDLVMFGYGERKNYFDQQTSSESEYFETDYCSYGYLLPEFGFVCFDNAYFYNQLCNLESYRFFKEDNPYLSSYDPRYIKESEIEGYVEVHSNESRSRIALTNSVIMIVPDVSNLAIKVENVYYMWNIHNNTKYENPGYNTNAYIDGKEWHLAQ